MLLAALIGVAPSVHARWDVSGTAATESRVFENLGDYKNAAFGVDWDRTAQCRPVITLFLIKGTTLGKFKAVTRASTRMTVKIDGRSWAGETILASHENGNAVMFFAPNDLVSKIQTATDIYVQIFEGGRVLIFDGRGSRGPILEAKRNCKP